MTEHDAETAAALAEYRLQLATRELRRRLALGHTAGCACQSRPALSCRELRRIVGWVSVAELEREVNDAKDS